MKSAMKSMVVLQTLLIVTFFSFACREASASQKKEARITQVIQDVKLLPGSAAPRPAVVNDDVREGTVVRTGQDSRTELTFSNQTLTRLGANSVFSFTGGGQALDLGQGSILMQVPPDGSTAKVKTAAVTAAISGGTALFGVGPPMKFMVLEGIGTFYPPGHPEGITLHGGEMITLTADGQLIGPTGFDLKKVLESAELLLPPFTDLANLRLIWQVITWQEADQTNGFKHSPKDPTEIETRDQAASSTPTPFESPTATPATPTPTPTGTPAALKFGTPPTITSPVPYVINSTTVINTDPTITTDAVTDQGTIYRNPAADGPRATWMFGSTSAFDTTSGFASGPDSGNMNDMAVFKFTSLQITGNPTVNVPSEGDPSNLGLIGVNGITTSGGGGTLTFDNVSMLLLATQNGSITLGGEFSFSGMDRMHIYARGTGSTLTIGSAITTNNDLRLYSEGTVQVNGDVNTINFSSFSGGDWLNGSGVINANGIYITSLGNITLDGQDFPDLPGGGGDISAHAANTLTVTISGGTNTRENFLLVGTTVNLVSDTPVVLTLMATTPTITGGSGGINGSNVGLIGGDMQISTTDGGNISLYSVDILNNTITGKIDAAGSFTSVGDVTINTLNAGTTITIGGNAFVANMTAGSTIDVVGSLAAFFTVTAGGNITADSVSVTTIDAPTGILTAGTGGIHPFVKDSVGPDDGAMIQHTFNVATVVSPNGIDFSGNQFDGTDGFSSGGLLTINATTQIFGDGGIAFANFNGADVNGFPTDFPDGGPAAAGDGGTFIVNATGNITTVLGADITATTGLNGPEDHGFSGNGGNVTLNSSGGTVTVDSLIQVSSNDGPSEEPIRRSASGGNITLHSGLTTGLGVSIGGNAQLLSLLNQNAPGPGGTILITTAGADIHMGEFSGAFLIADRGTIDIHQTAAGTSGTSLIEIYNTALSAETITIDSSGDFELGIEGFVFLDGVTLSLTADNNLDMAGFFSSATAVESDGNVTIFGANVTSEDDLTISRTNGGRDSGVNISVSAGSVLTINGTLSLTTRPDGLISGGNILVSAPTISITGDTVLVTDTLENVGIGANITVTGNLTTQALIAHVLVGQFAGRPAGPLGGFDDPITLTSGGNITVTAPNGLNLSTSGTFGASELFVSTSDFGEILTGGNITLTVGTLLVPANLLSDAPLDMEINTFHGGHIGDGANILATVHGNFTVSHLFVGIFNDFGSIDNGGTITLEIDGTLTTTVGDATFVIDHSDALTIPTQTAIDVSAASISVAGNLDAYIDDSTAGGSATGTTGTVGIHAVGTINVTGALNVLGNVTSDNGDITAGTISSTNVTVTSVSPTAGIHAGTGGIRPFAIPGELFVNVLHTLSAPVVTSAGGINFNGVNADGDFSMATNAGALTINANSLSIGSGPGFIGPLAFLPANIVGPVTFNGGDGSSTFDPASGGTFTVNTTGAITVNSDIEATTGHFPSAPSATPAGFGGTVNLNSTTGTVTVNSRIEVSSAEPASTIAPFRQSNKGGNIKITSGKIGGSAITVGSTAQLLSKLDTLATGGGGKIELSATGAGSSIDVNNSGGRIEADQGTIDINHHGINGAINISNANMIADVIKIQLFGDNGVLTIGGGIIDANSALTLYAAGGTGSIVFNADVTLNSNSAAIIAANTVTINLGVSVFIDSTNPALVYANVRNYVGSGGDGGAFGSFTGAGATSQPFDPDNPPVVAQAGTVGSPSATSGSNPVTRPILISALAPAGTQNSQSGGVLLAASQSAAKRIFPPLSGRGVVSRRLEPPSDLANARRLMATSRTTARTSGSAVNVNNSAQLLSLLEAPPDSSGRINFVQKPRSGSQKSAGTPTTRLNSGKVAAPYGNSTTISEPNATQTAPARNTGSGSGANTQIDNRTSSATTGGPGGALSY